MNMRRLVYNIYEKADGNGILRKTSMEAADLLLDIIQ